MRKLSWVPIHKGNIFCSPACGANCKYVDYVQANKRASALSKNLGGKWKSRVWENMGWFWNAVIEKGGVYPYSRGEYWASLIMAGLQFHAVGRSPREAVQRALTLAEKKSRALSNDLVKMKREDSHDK